MKNVYSASQEKLLLVGAKSALARHFRVSKSPALIGLSQKALLIIGPEEGLSQKTHIAKFVGHKNDDSIKLVQIRCQRSFEATNHENM